MHKAIYREYERLFDQPFTGKVLEVGATPYGKCLLQMEQLSGAERVGLNLTGPHECDSFTIFGGNANSMPFANEAFDLVLCNALIEHDKFFWKTVAEIKRVTKPGGMVVIGAPGYRVTAVDRFQNRMGRWFKRLQRSRTFNALFTATLTFKIHDAPGDYYRFSPQAFREVIMDGMEDIEIRSVMLPPRLIAVGRKPISP